MLSYRGVGLVGAAVLLALSACGGRGGEDESSAAPDRGDTTAVTTGADTSAIAPDSSWGGYHDGAMDTASAAPEIPDPEEQTPQPAAPDSSWGGNYDGATDSAASAAPEIPDPEEQTPQPEAPDAE